MSADDQLKLRAAFIADAIRLLGRDAFAEGMKASARSVNYWASADPRRPVSDAILRDTMELLVAHRQRTNNLIRIVRLHLDGGVTGQPAAGDLIEEASNGQD